MYDLLSYARMMSDRRRVDVYRAALREAITPGDVVVEIGTGIGAFAVMARQMGARRVIAIEPNDAIAIARLIAADNGCESGITFIQDLSSNVVLNEPADVLIADLRGALPVAATYLASMIDARERLLRPGGVVVPAVDTLRVAVVEAPEVYAQLRPSCRFDDIDVNLQALAQFTTNALGHVQFDSRNLLTSAESWAHIDYRTIVNPNVAGRVQWQALRNGVGHGFAVWFDSMLTESVFVSNAPTEPNSAWGMAFFPWSNPVDLVAGDAINAAIEARFTGSGYVWRWRTEIPIGAAIYRARFDQSTMYRRPANTAEAMKAAPAHVGELTEEGRIQRFILQAMDGKTSNDAVARRLAAAFPARFADEAQALARVAELSQSFSSSPAIDGDNVTTSS
jgi:type I protein arginine methyltransferase